MIKLQIPSRVVNLLLSLFDIKDVYKQGNTTVLITDHESQILKFLGDLQ